MSDVNKVGKLQTAPRMRLTEGSKRLPPALLSASEIYRPSGRRLSAKLVPTFVDREFHVVSLTDPRLSRPQPLFFLPSSSSILCTHEAEWTSFQTHYFASSGNRTRTSGIVARNSGHYTTEEVLVANMANLATLE
jgi:hypothetical protein